MDPITLSLLLAGAGAAAGAGGGFLGQQNALQTAQNEAAAGNASVAKNVGILDGFEQNNQATQNANLANYTPTAQSAQLATDQATRGNANVANISPTNPSSVPIQADASPATRSDLASRMLSLHDAATQRAQAQGTLGGYGDTWQQNQIGNQNASNTINTQNNIAGARQALIQPEAQLAEGGAYSPPSIWGPLLQGAGSVASAAGGAGLGGALKNGIPGSNPVNVGSATSATF